MTTPNDDKMELTYPNLLAFRESVRSEIGIDPAILVERCVDLGICTRDESAYRRTFEQVKARP